MTNFILGCANFFYKYGLRKGTLTPEDINFILEKSISYGICNLDSALIYENNESPINLSKDISNSIEVGTKIGMKEINIDKPKSLFKLRENLEKSLEIWGKDKFSYIYSHDMITSKRDLDKWLFLDDYLKKECLCNQTGISIYDLKDIRYFEDIKIDRIQMPDNLYWQRNKEFLEIIKNKAEIVDVRSIFLQGIIVNPPEGIMTKIPKNLLLHHSKIWSEYNSDTKKLYDLAIAYIKSKNFNNIVFGIESIDELKKFINSFRKVIKQKDYNKFKYNEKDIDPRVWKN